MRESIKDTIMNESFEVEIYPIKKQVNSECDKYRYMARWNGRQYIADNIMCHISAVRPDDDITYGHSWTEYESRAPYETTFKCHSRTLDACISEAEHVLKNCLFGKAELLDGKYRVATVTKRYDDEYTNSGLTRYGKKCKKSEPNGTLSCADSTLSCADSKSVLMSIDELDAYYDEY